MQGAVYDEVDKSGAPRARSMLMWPQTEYVKACVARFDATGQTVYRDKALAHWQLMRTVSSAKTAATGSTRWALGASPW